MAIIGDALRQTFMPKHEYESLREEDKAWAKLQRPFLISIFMLVSLLVIVFVVLSLRIVFPGNPLKRPFCGDRKIEALRVNDQLTSDDHSDVFYLSDQETVDYYWMVVFLPTMIVFLVAVVYLVSGVLVAYSAPRRHRCLAVVENKYCASKRGGIRSLSIVNAVFAIIFGLLAMFLGSSLLTLGSICSLPLFWCYEIASWGLVFLFAGTAMLLRRRTVLLIDEGGFSGRNLGVEMLEAAPLDVTPDVVRNVNEGFRSWMGSTLLSSDEDDDSDGVHEMLPPSIFNTRQRV